MKTRTASGLILVGLGILLTAQVGVMAYRFTRPALVAQDRLAAGDALGELAITDSEGVAARLASDADAQTLLMVFHSDCGWCRQVAPAWRDWLSTPPEGLRVIAVSSEPTQDAMRYAAEMGWPVEVASVTVRKLGDAAHSLTSRTPWLFLLDEHGVIRFEGQGSRLDALDAALDRTTVYSTEEEQ